MPFSFDLVLCVGNLPFIKNPHTTSLFRLGRTAISNSQRFRFQLAKLTVKSGTEAKL
jgi:hypothetical protein